MHASFSRKRMLSLGVVSAVVAFGGALGVASCGGTTPSGFTNGDAGDAATADDTNPFPDDRNLFGDSPAGDGGSCAKCSGDLHSVLDCNNNVVSTCPASQGCAGGVCVPACDAAKANKSSVGCDYYAVPATDFVSQTCFAAFVSNTWGSPVKVTVARGNNTYNNVGFVPQGSGIGITYTPLVNNTIPTGSVAIFFLSVDSGTCPKTPAVTGSASVPGTAITDGFHITTDAPVFAATIFPYGGGSSAVTGATLLLPTSAWDDNYIATAAWSETGFGNPWIAVVAQEDATDVTIVPTTAIVAGGTVSAGAANVPKTYTLQKGQVMRLQQPLDLSGSVLKATKPIGSWGGHGCTNIEAAACDGMHQQIPPVKALGSEYTAVRYRDRYPGVPESPPWRFVGAVDGTTLTYGPPQSGAPATLKRGQVIEFDSNGQYTVKSQDGQHPFFFGAHMTGCTTNPNWSNSPLSCAGDPEFVNVIPPAQYLASYIFFTDPTYPETELLVVRQKASDNTFHDVKLDCKGTLTGWQPIGSSGKYEYVRADLVTGNFAKVGNCDNGRHEASSDVPFGLTVWGWGSGLSSSTLSSTAVSYAYPAGASVQPINTVVVPPTPN
ncbi:hypothetical protein BH09MYX1_BH09MYX1_20140 [soil metagenome]